MVEMDVSLICKALGDSNRLRIVRALLEGLCAGEAAAGTSDRRITTTKIQSNMRTRITMIKIGRAHV